MPALTQASFALEGSHLERYASRLSGVEINSSFYRPHKPATYARWAASVPPGFRFAVKVPKAITHERKLAEGADLLDAFLGEAGQLGDKLGPLLVQLPPSLASNADRDEAFLSMLRKRHGGPVVIEPRHASWFGEDARTRLIKHRIALVRVDPAPCEGADWAMGDASAEGRVAYYRLHGSPRIYHSSYDDAYLQALAGRLRDDKRRFDAVWCIFDNTASGAATANALTLLGLL